jgi:MFS family permease
VDNPHKGRERAAQPHARSDGRSTPPTMPPPPNGSSEFETARALALAALNVGGPRPAPPPPTQPLTTRQPGIDNALAPPERLRGHAVEPVPGSDNGAGALSPVRPIPAPPAREAPPPPPEAGPATRFKLARPLRIRDFFLLWSGMTVSLLGDGIFFIALPLQVLALRNDAATLSLILTAYTLPLVLFLVVGGVLSDRFQRRSMLLLATGLQGVSVAALGLLAATGALTLPWIGILVVFYGAGEAIFGPAFGAIVPDIVPADQLVEANSLDNFSRPFALRIVGPAVGGALIAIFGLGGAFIADALSFVLAGLAFFFLHTRRQVRVPEGAGLIWDDVKVGFRFVRAHTWLWGTLIASGVGLLVFFGPWQALVPLVVVNKLGGGEGQLATIFSVGGIGALVASVVIGQTNLPRRYMTAMFICFAGGCFMLTGFGLATEVWHAVVASFFMQALLTTGIIIWGTTMHRLVPGEILGRVSSLDWLVSTGLIPVSLLLAWPLAKLIGPDTTLVAAGIFGCVLVLSFMLIPGVRAPESVAGART